MPRGARKESGSGCHHVIIRGNNRQVLFRDNADFEKFAEIVKLYLPRDGVKLHHYCLMSNHVHLLVGCENIKILCRFMHGIQRSYHHYYRKTYTFFGHLTQGRFRSYPIEDDGYLLECGRYIERNPVQAKMVQRPEQWPYTSYRFYAEGKTEDFLTASQAYLGLAGDALSRQVLYRQHVESVRPYEDVIYKKLERI